MRNQINIVATCPAKRFDPNVEIIPGRDVAQPQSARPAAPINGARSPKPKNANGAIKPISGDADTLTRYLQEIGTVPLLGADEEAALARRVQKGDEAAREQMIKANLRLVVRIATHYQNHGLCLLDLISEGNIGLMTAVERFDPTRGARLSTYAGIWIKQSIRRAIGNYGRTIRLPVHVVEDVIRMRQISSRLEEVLGREPDDIELAREMNLRPQRVARMRQAASRIGSLDEPLDPNDEHSECLRDIFADERSSWTPAQQAEKQASLETLGRVLKSLHPREQLVLRDRFGLKGGSEHTLETIGRKLGLTRERIRQIERTAMKKLRKKLTEFRAMEGCQHNGAGVSQFS